MLIGVTWTIWAWKWVIVEYLKVHGYRHYSAREYFTNLLQWQWLEVTRSNMIALANWLREKYGWSYIIGQLIERAEADWGDAVVESIRALDEVEILRKYWGILIGIDAPQHLRYERAVKRGTSLDHITFEQFVFDEHVEGSSPDPSKSNIFACLPLCDHVFTNDGTLEELYAQLDEYFASLNLKS